MYKVKKELIERLTSMEIEILRMMSDGMSNGTIAGLMNLKKDSIKTYIGIIYEKLDMEDVPITGKRALAISIYHQTQRGFPQGGFH